MLEGHVRAAVRWLTENSGGGVLKPSDSTTIGGASMTVLEIMNLSILIFVLSLIQFYHLWINYHFLRIPDLTSYQ